MNMMLECTLLLDEVNNGALAISVIADIALGDANISNVSARTAENFLPSVNEWDDIFNISCIGLKMNHGFSVTHRIPGASGAHNNAVIGSCHG
jgi:hypothetical protein